jgi:O-antigen/teichoic acid export membrane protein
MVVPLTIDYLNNENYGIWLTLSSFISWFSFFDIGLGNGLRNKFAEAKALGNYESAKAYVSTAYYTIAGISFVLIICFVSVNFFVDWSVVFNTSNGLEGELAVLMPIVFGFFGLQLVAKLITTIYQADQHHSIQNKVQFFTQVLSLLVIWILTKTAHSSLLLFGLIYSALPVLILLALNVYGFKNTFKKFKPELSWWNKDQLKDITGLGFKFFVVQIAAMILFSTDNIIITQLFGPDEVVPYNISYKYFSIVLMGYSLLITPFWSSFTEAFANEEFNWIKKSVSKIQKIWMLVPIVLVVMIYFSNWFYYLWVGEKVTVPLHLSIAMALFVALNTFNSIYVNFINGVGKIKIQLITAIISMIINIPLSVYFGKYMGWGSTGVILATCF